MYRPSTVERQAKKIRELRRRQLIPFIIIAALATALIAVSVIGYRNHNRDQARIGELTSANEKLDGENKTLHRINDEIGKERNEAIKWLEAIQPGINFDGI